MINPEFNIKMNNRLELTLYVQMLSFSNATLIYPEILGRRWLTVA